MTLNVESYLIVVKYVTITRELFYLWHRLFGTLCYF